MLDKFFGDHTWAQRTFDREDCLRLYMNKLANTFLRLRHQPAYVDAIRVGTTQYFYDMVLLCRNGGYVNVWGEYMKNRWNWVNPKHMERLLDYLKGKETRMDNFLGTA